MDDFAKYIHVFVFFSQSMIGLAWLGLAWLGLAWLGLAVHVASTSGSVTDRDSIVSLDAVGNLVYSHCFNNIMLN